jgi:ketosteroid isomerase-like protein
MSRENVEIVRRSVELFDGRNLAEGIEALDGLEVMDPDVELDLSRNIFNPDVYRGHAGIQRWGRMVEEVWDNFQGTTEELIDMGDKVVVAVKMGGKGKESGVEVQMRIYSIWTVRDSKVVQVVGGYRDRSEALEAAG